MNIGITLLGQAISFAIFVAFCMKFVWPPLINALRERQKNISDGLAAADKARADLAQAEKTVSEMVQEGKNQATTIIANANKRAATIVEEAKDQAETEKQRIIVAAEEEIKLGAQKARTELSSSLQGLVIEGVGKIIGKEVDITTHKEVINDLESHLKQ